MPAVEGIAGPQVLEIGAHIGAAEVRVEGHVEAPGHEEVVLRARPLDRRLGLAVHVELGVALAEPERAAGTDGQDRADVMALALGVQDEIIAARLFRKLVAVLGAEIARPGRHRLLGKVDVIIEGADVLGALVGHGDDAVLIERHGEVQVVAVPALDHHGQGVDLTALPEAGGKEVTQGGLDGRRRRVIPVHAQYDFVGPGRARRLQPVGPGLVKSQPDVVDDRRPLDVGQHLRLAGSDVLDAVGVAGRVGIGRCDGPGSAGLDLGQAGKILGGQAGRQNQNDRKRERGRTD